MFFQESIHKQVLGTVIGFSTTFQKVRYEPPPPPPPRINALTIKINQVKFWLICKQKISTFLNEERTFWFWFKLNK